MFASWHALADPSSGAAQSMRQLLSGLLPFGWSAKILTGPRLDFSASKSIGGHLQSLGFPYEEKSLANGSLNFSLYHYCDEGVPATIFSRELGNAQEPDDGALAAFLAIYERILETFQPDVLLTYGGGRIGWELMRRAKGRGIKVVFTLRNFAYHDARFFQFADSVLVPSAFSADYYLKKLGLKCTAIPSPIDWSRIQVKVHPEEKRFVTFVNPSPVKGVFVFARIALELGRLRPEIPLLVVESRGQTDWLAKVPLDLSRLTNLHRMANTPDPRDFYKVTRVMLMPSLWNESFGRVAAESLINGIPVLASHRGALPEVLTDTGFLFEIPAKYTPESRESPSAEEIQPWVETIVRLWDDATFYEEGQQTARMAAKAFRTEKILAQHDEFFRKVSSFGSFWN